jgi:hypothetical protein
MSSFNPIKNKTIQPAINCWTPLSNLPKILNADRKPLNIANPPNRGVKEACIVLPLGSFSRFLECAICIIDGIAKTEIRKAQRKGNAKSGIVFKIQQVRSLIFCNRLLRNSLKSVTTYKYMLFT